MMIALTLSPVRRLAAQVPDSTDHEALEERWCAPPTKRTAEVTAAAATDARLCLTMPERVRLLALRTTDPLLYGEIVLSTGWAQLERTPPQWRQDWRGFGRRLGASALSWSAGAVAEMVTAAALEVDPRPTFSRLADGRPSLRIALTNAVTLRRRDGSRVFDVPQIASSVAGGLAFGSFRPSGRRVEELAINMAVSFALSTTVHVSYEYWRWWRKPRPPEHG